MSLCYKRHEKQEETRRKEKREGEKIRKMFMFFLDTKIAKHDPHTYRRKVSASNTKITRINFILLSSWGVWRKEDGQTVQWQCLLRDRDGKSDTYLVRWKGQQRFSRLDRRRYQTKMLMSSVIPSCHLQSLVLWWRPSLLLRSADERGLVFSSFRLRFLCIFAWVGDWRGKGFVLSSPVISFFFFGLTQSQEQTRSSDPRRVKQEEEGGGSQTMTGISTMLLFSSSTAEAGEGSIWEKREEGKEDEEEALEKNFSDEGKRIMKEGKRQHLQPFSKWSHVVSSPSTFFSSCHFASSLDEILREPVSRGSELPKRFVTRTGAATSRSRNKYQNLAGETTIKKEWTWRESRRGMKTKETCFFIQNQDQDCLLSSFSFIQVSLSRFG